MARKTKTGKIDGRTKEGRAAKARAEARAKGKKKKKAEPKKKKVAPKAKKKASTKKRKPSVGDLVLFIRETETTEEWGLGILHSIIGHLANVEFAPKTSYEQNYIVPVENLLRATYTEKGLYDFVLSVSNFSYWKGYKESVSDEKITKEDEKKAVQIDPALLVVETASQTAEALETVAQVHEESEAENLKIVEEVLKTPIP